MRMLMKSLLTVSAVFSLAPEAAFAYLPQCYEVCESYSACSEPCAVGLGTWITCGEYDPTGCVPGVAGPSAPSAPTASVTESEARQADAASQVCSEENQAAEQAATAES